MFRICTKNPFENLMTKMCQSTLNYTYSISLTLSLYTSQSLSRSISLKNIIKITIIIYPTWYQCERLVNLKFVCVCVSAGRQEPIGQSGCLGTGRDDASQHRRYQSHRWVCKTFAIEFLTSVCLDSVVCSSPALAALAGSQLRTANANRAQQQQHEMTVSNDLIGCIIGKGGTKIAEIRQISGAMIRISNCEEREGGNTDRTITISGNPDSVALAQYLINMRWVLLQRL